MHVFMFDISYDCLLVPLFMFDVLYDCIFVQPNQI